MYKRGPTNVTNGYKNNPEANKTSFQFGCFRAGDLGYFDSQEYLNLWVASRSLLTMGVPI